MAVTGKFQYAIITAFAIELALWLFGGTTYNQTPLFTMLTNPSTIMGCFSSQGITSCGSNALFLAFLVALTGFAIASVIVGSFFQVNPYAVYAPLALALLWMGMPILQLSIFIYGQLANSIGVTGSIATLITSIIVGPIIVFYLIAVIEWVRSNI